MKGKLYEFTNEIYPHSLWVYIGGTIEEIKSLFLSYDGDELFVSSKKFGAWTCNVIAKKNDKYGVVVFFPYPNLMRMNVICHEATHALFYFCDAFGLSTNAEDNGEHLAYLMGWIGGCINIARLKKVPSCNEEFEIKEENKTDNDKSNQEM